MPPAGAWQTEGFLIPISGAQSSGVLGGCGTSGRRGELCRVWLQSSSVPLGADGPESPCGLRATESIHSFNKCL